MAEIVGHWLTGPGGNKNPDRQEALALVRVVADIESLLAQTATAKPTLLATCARERTDCQPYSSIAERLAGGENFLIFFGTGWGLTTETLAMMDGMLPPIRGTGDYNHLSVRSAVAIVLDRLRFRNQKPEDRIQKFDLN